MLAAAVLVFALVLGSLPTGVLVARGKGVDLRRVGSGNVGATNVGRALGKGWAVFVLLVDAGKGYVPVLLAKQLGLPPLVAAGAGLVAIAGHVFSIFLRGHGGKGVATALGAALAIAPAAAGGAAGLWVGFYALFRISSVGSLGGVCAFPLLLWWLGPREPAYLGFGLATTALVVARHKENIRRLVRGEELKG